MSIAGYLSGGKTEARMSKKRGDELGIRFEGAVLTGGKSVEEGVRESAVRATMPADEYYGSVEDYDAVLRSHCG